MNIFNKIPVFSLNDIQIYLKEINELRKARDDLIIENFRLNLQARLKDFEEKAKKVYEVMYE